MILFANFLIAIAGIIHVVLNIYIYIIIIRAILTWVRVPSLYPVAVFLYKLTEPVMRPFRRLVPPNKVGGIDITPIIVILVILFVDSFLVESVAVYARQLLREHALQF